MKTLSFLVMIGVTFLYGCEDFYGWTYVNYADHSIEVFFLRPAHGNQVYPDTTLAFSKPGLIEVGPNDRYSWSELGDIELFFAPYPSDTVSVFFLHQDTVKKYSWDKIKADYNILARYDLSLNDLKVLNNEIPYPPSSQMLEMRIYKK